MQKIAAISWLTWKAAFRFRLFLVITVLLLASVVCLPILIKDDGTARGFTQILLTYTLTTITALLGFSTLWLACGTLARDIEECQIQVVAVKPVARWQIWLGKWLGLVSLNAVLLVLSGLSVYALLQWRAGHLPPAEQHVLRNEVLVARGSAHESNRETEITAEIDGRLQERLKAAHAVNANLAEVRDQIRDQVLAEMQVVGPGYLRIWEIDLGPVKEKLHGQPLYLRTRFNAAEKSDSGTFVALWQVGDQAADHVWQSAPMSFAPDTFHEFEIPADLLDPNGRLTIVFRNANAIAMLFPLDDGMEVLYRESSFEMNYLRGLGIIFCWMSLLAALGLTAASFLSFPVAAFCCITVLGITLCSGTVSDAVAQNSLLGWDPQAAHMERSLLDGIALPAFRVMITVINLAKDFSPIDSLSTGRNISGSVLLEAVLKIVVLLGGIIGAIGIYCLHRRELATAQGSS